MQALFGENVCENERTGSRRGRAPEIFVCRSATVILNYPLIRVKGT